MLVMASERADCAGSNCGLSERAPGEGYWLCWTRGRMPQFVLPSVSSGSQQLIVEERGMVKGS